MKSLKSRQKLTSNLFNGAQKKSNQKDWMSGMDSNKGYKLSQIVEHYAVVFVPAQRTSEPATLY